MLVPKLSIPQSRSWRGEMSLEITPSCLILCTAMDTGKARGKKLIERKPTLRSPAEVKVTQNLADQ